jgi:hypothetical protein
MRARTWSSRFGGVAASGVAAGVLPGTDIIHSVMIQKDMSFYAEFRQQVATEYTPIPVFTLRWASETLFTDQSQIVHH